MSWAVSCSVAELAKPAMNNIDNPMNATNAIEIRFVSDFTAVCVAVVIFSSPYRLPRRCLLTHLRGRSPGLWIFAGHRLPGVTQWHMMPANHIQSRGRLRLWAPIWVVPQRIPVSSPNACANMWGTLQNKLSGIRGDKSRNLRIPLDKYRIVVNYVGIF